MVLLGSRYVSAVESSMILLKIQQLSDFNNDLKGGVFVALKQTRGEDNVLFGIKLKQIPMIYLFAACLLVLAGLGEH